ncbi:hypothetical protein ACS15_3686 [Ralstonia insidiosa]|uniref:Uncharacterized protein n=1 Tax=Ralstonia insidiosa TaxID=190721 RepID=A0AAC9FR85_9RALS|nr:hypothetical protein ACS15_3686 [Ralstonia insidiosa]
MHTFPTELECGFVRADIFHLEYRSAYIGFIEMKSKGIMSP